MKTMQLDEKIVRVSDSEGANLFLKGWSYVSKTLWKEKVRDVNKKEKTTKKKKGKKKKK
tara:strand:- start:231 stop:407 length:177 start_codon:yes stop_codon:yes gene_type:complete